MNKELKFPIMGEKINPWLVKLSCLSANGIIAVRGDPESRLLKLHASPLSKWGREQHGAGFGPADEAADRAG